jgi:hypothetical protein
LNREEEKNGSRVNLIWIAVWAAWCALVFAMYFKQFVPK